jgi:hypothetical protein
LGSPQQDRVSESALPEPGEVGEGRPAAGEHDQVGTRNNIGVGRHLHPDPRLSGQRIEVGGVGDPLEPHDGDVEDPGPARCPKPGSRGPPTGERQGVLRVDPHVGQEGHDTQHRPPGALLQHVEAGLEQRNVTPELVDHPPAQAGLVLGIQQAKRAVHRCKHAASVDVAHDDDRQSHSPGQAKVDEVTLAQVDLCWAAGTLGDDDVEASGQVIERRKSGLCQRLPPGGPLTGA